MEDSFKFQGRRRLLALELKKKGIVNKQIIKSIESIPRHLFIDPGLSEQAYIDKALPIESSQTISQPYTVAFQTQLLNPVSGEKILEIGTGSGYQTSILCFLKTDVYTIERNHNLFRSTTKLFNRLNIKPGRFKYGDGYKGLIDDSQLDGILITDSIRAYNIQRVSEKKYGRNEKVMVKSPEGDTDFMKYKKAVPLLEKGYEIV